MALLEEALVIFFKTPELGKVKTRLAASIGDKLALEVYEKMLAEVFETSKAWKKSNKAKTVLFYGQGDPSDWTQFGVLDGKRQWGNDLGQKMQRAMNEALKLAKKVIIIGTDNPDLKVSDIERSFNLLNDHQVVFGPCEDGGYYLMGVKRMPATLLWDLPWSTSATLKKLCQRCDGHHMDYIFLDQKVDIDTLEDLKKHQFAPELWKSKL